MGVALLLHKKNEVKRAFIHPNYRSFFSRNLLITGEAANAFFAELFLRDSFEGGDTEEPSYTKDAENLATVLSAEQINLTTRFGEMELPDNSIALHMIHGTIFAEYDPWDYWFSTKQFVDDLRAAETNPKIIAHLLHINSGGGEAWYLDVAAAQVKALKKPCIAVIEDVGASAAYYLAAYAKKIYAITGFDIVGSIGTMTSFLDVIPYFEKMGAKYIEEYATQSTRKNKKYNDLRQGKPEQFKKEVLDPLAQQFIDTVKDARPAIPDNDRGVFQGETFFTQAAADLGLIDGRKTPEEIIQEIYSLGIESSSKIQAHHKAIKLL